MRRIRAFMEQGGKNACRLLQLEQMVHVRIALTSTVFVGIWMLVSIRVLLDVGRNPALLGLAPYLSQPAFLSSPNLLSRLTLLHPRSSWSSSKSFVR